MGTLVKLEHEGIARIYDGGLYEDPQTHDQLPYIAMELVRGGLPLTTYAKDYALAWPERLALFPRVCRAVQYAHEYRVIHRDLKPANILVDPEGRPVVIDFGLACAYDALLPSAHLAASGTPAYMSPEQVSNAFGAVSDKSDVYALGLILYELLTGHPPYVLPHGGAVEAWGQVITEVMPPPLSQHDRAYGGELEAIVASALAKRPVDRPSVAVLRSRLERTLQQLLAERDRPLHDTHHAPRDLQARAPLPLVPLAPPTSLLPAPGTASGPGAARQDSSVAERRQVTILFCDLVGSTALSGQLDPEDLREVLRAYRETCAAVITRFGGNLDKFLGDGALVCFGYPQAHDDDPQRAVRAALGIVEAMTRVNTHLAQTCGVQLAVRIGIHTGLVVAGTLGVGETRDPQAIVGEAPNLAARLQELATPNTVVCSAATARLVDGYFILEALGPQVLKGVTAPVSVYRVVGETEARTRLDIASTRGLTPFVGREPEVALLLERWAAATDGRGQVVVLSGEAGIGKSRLVQAFTAQLTGAAYTRIVYDCSPYYQQSPLYPVVAHLQRLLQFRADDPPAEQLRKLEATLRAYDFALEEVVPLVAALLSLPPPEHYSPLTLTPERQKQKTLETLLAWVLREAERQPVCVVMEDLHWVDPSTLEFLSLLITQIPTARVLLLLLCRPEFQPPWAVHSYLTHLALDRLSTRQTEAMIGQVVGGKSLPAVVVQKVMATTDGVPLFVEELTKLVLESGLVTEREGQYALTGALPPLAVPATLHDVLMARLDRLGPAKLVAQLGAVVGREFPYAVLQAVAPMEEALLAQGLAQLVKAELLYQRGVLPQARYTFKHVLIQEAAYQSVLKSTRQQYHQQIAQVWETQFPHLVETQPELLAHHYTEAGLNAQAVDYWQRAGQQASARSALREAVASFEQALVAVRHLPQCRETLEQAIDLRLDLRNALIALREFGAILHHLHEAETLATDLDDSRRLGRVSAYMASHFSSTQTYDQARAVEYGERALALAAASGDFALERIATFFLGYAYFHGGHYRQVVSYLRKNIEALVGEWLYARFGEAGLPSISNRVQLVRSLAELGEFPEGSARGTEAVRIAETIEQPFSLAEAYLGLGVLYLRQGDLIQAIAILEKAFAVCQTSDILMWLPNVTSTLGYAYALSGRFAEALPLLEQVVEQGGSPQMSSYLSEAYLLAGCLEDASQLAGHALASARDFKLHGQEAYALRLLGEIAVHRNPPEVEPAAAAYRQALTLAEELGMRPLQAHCHRSLGTLYAATSQREQARTELSTAIALYRDMEMTFWLPQAEAALARSSSAFEWLSS
jgi:class 3 adenylate cyclase/tetratricopeptide (TPR) repeat protein